MAALYVTSSEKGSGKTAICAGLTKLLAAKGKDLTIVEGSSEQFGASRDKAAPPNAKVIIVEAYSKELLKKVDDYKKFGASLLGVILNKVPKTRMEQTQTEASARLKQAGISLLGMLPEDRALLTLTVGELAERVHGEFLLGVERSGELVENLMLAALGLDPGPEYFGRKANKAAILRSDRPDVQMAALETSSRCLVLAGDTRINPVVLNRAKSQNVPLISARGTVPELVTTIESAVIMAPFSQSKLPRLIELLEQHLDLPKISQGLG